MKKFAILLIAILTSGVSLAYETIYQKSDSVRVEQLLRNAPQTDKAGTILYFARQLRGIPYVAHTLEVNKTEKLVVNLRQLDCTTYVENVTALYLCVKQKKRTFKNFCDNLRRIRYRGGSEPAYSERLHYYTDWINDNTSMGICKEIQSPVPPFSAVQKVNVYFMSTYPEKYKMLNGKPELIKKIARTEQEVNKRSYKYIPKAKVLNTNLMRQTVKDGDIIAITTTLKGLDIQHIGFAVWHKDGLHMLNASSLRHKVVEEPQTLYTYLKGKKSMTGIRIVRLN